MNRIPVTTRLLPTASGNELAAAVEAAARELTEGHPVALPTETVYGLAANAFDASAAFRIFEAKERPSFDPLIVHLPGVEWLDRVARVPESDRPLVQALAAAFWPGPLTLVLPRQAEIPDIVTSGLETVAVRVSAHPIFTAIAKAAGFPLAAPSANRFGRISPTAAAHVMSELNGRIPLIIDGGPTIHGVESTIIAVANGSIAILRNGPITRDDLSSFAPIVAPETVAKPVAPGQLKSHYAPGTPLYLAPHRPEPGKRVGLLAWQNAPRGGDYAAVEILSPGGNLREAASHLFAAMRRLDEAGLDAIIAEPVPEEGLGVAIMDRLRKAAYRSSDS